MNIESYYFICPECKKGYRGLLANCPHCNYKLRDKHEVAGERTWELAQRIVEGVKAK